MATEHKPLYKQSLRDAIDLGEIERWRDSYRENCDCARAIERAISENYHNNVLQNGTAPILERYGFARVNWVLANTIQEKNDGRFSRENKSWAKDFFFPKDDVRWHFCVESHPGLTNLFVDQVRNAWQDLGLFDHRACTQDGEYAQKVLLLRPDVLKDEFKSPENQLFFAQSGFGCSATAGGRAVFGRFLIDGEAARFNRGDFMGVIKDECLPEWARERLQEMGVSMEAPEEGPVMGGM